MSERKWPLRLSGRNVLPASCRAEIQNLASTVQRALALNLRVPWSHGCACALVYVPLEARGPGLVSLSIAFHLRSLDKVSQWTWSLWIRLAWLLVSPRDPSVIVSTVLGSQTHIPSFFCGHWGFEHVCMASIVLTEPLLWIFGLCLHHKL